VSGLLAPEALTPDGALLTSVRDAARAGSPMLIATAGELARRAEPSWKEFRTTEYLVRRYRELGFDVETFDQDPGFVARLGRSESSYPPVALRCELDGLPDSRTGHARHLCGHNYHCAAVLHAAQILAQLSRDLGLQVIVIGQPAEEDGTPQSGAPFMIARGALRFGDRQACAVLAFHGDTSMREGQIAVLRGGGPFYAGLIGVAATIAAPGGHAGRPHTTPATFAIFRRFLDALEDEVRRRFPPGERFVFSFQTATVGDIPSRVASRGEAHGEFRWFTPGVEDRMSALLAQVVAQFNLRPAITVGVKLIPGYMPTVVDPTLMDYMAEAAAHVAHVIDAEPSLFVEDVGAYGRLGGVPIGFVNVGLGERDYAAGELNPRELHSDQFTVSRRAQAQLWQASYVLAAAALMAMADKGHATQRQPTAPS
jgi:amidohydrolase